MQLQTDDVSTERLEAYKKDNSEFMHVSSVEAKLHIACDEATEDDLSVVFYDLSRIGVSNLFIYTFHVYQLCSQYKRLELHFFCILESSFFYFCKSILYNKYKHHFEKLHMYIFARTTKDSKLF